MNNTYAGIGSRSTPPEILTTMTQIAHVFASMGWTLRSGGAAGADTAFENGAGELKEIFYPKNFIPEWAFEISSAHHPAWNNLTPFVKRLMARNALQILGADRSNPSKFVICWTPDGSIDGSSRTSGGTGQALRIATTHNIPVYNLAKDVHLDAMKKLLEKRNS